MTAKKLREESRAGSSPRQLNMEDAGGGSRGPWPWNRRECVTSPTRLRAWNAILKHVLERELRGKKKKFSDAQRELLQY